MGTAGLFTTLPAGQEADRLAALRSYEVLDTPPDPALSGLVRLASVIVGTRFGALNLIDEHRTWAKATIGLPHGFEIARHQAFCAEAIRSPDEPLVIADTHAVERFAGTELAQLGVRFHVSVPLMTGEGHAIGALCIADVQPRDRPTELEIESLRTLAVAATSQLKAARQMARAERLNDELARLARHDALTGVPNRRAFDETLARERARCARDGRPLSVILLDLDNFKRYNDSRGHIAGDRMLRDCAERWSEELRDMDLLGRFGGEEFAVVLPGCSGEDAQASADRLRRATPSGQTCSAGVATCELDESCRSVLERADAALYAAKAAGRDATVRAAASSELAAA